MSNLEREYRKRIGFTNQEHLKKFFKATDITIVNWEKIKKCNERLSNIFERINTVIDDQFALSPESFSNFLDKIDIACEALQKHEIIEKKFNNNGRSCEDVYYNWMRGYLVSIYFVKVIAAIFSVEEHEIEQLGEDNLQAIIDNGDVSAFKKDAVADLKLKNKDVHIEVQAGFTGDNDIKFSKAKEARLESKKNCKTIIVHFDLFNGKVAAIDISDLEYSLSEGRWVQNARFEGAKTVRIPEQNFLWCITDPFPKCRSIITTIK